jgi:hypothetical protein
MIKSKPKPRRYIPDYTKAAPPRNGIDMFYAMLVQGGILLTIGEGDTLVIHAPLNNVSPVLQAAVEKRKAALVEHLRSLPA